MNLFGRFLFATALILGVSSFDLSSQTNFAFGSRKLVFRQSVRVCSCSPTMSVQTRSADEYPIGIVADFAKILLQSAILASASTVMSYKLPSAYFPSQSPQSSATLPIERKLPSLQFQRSYDIRCITDGFEFSQDGGPVKDLKGSLSYRQCEALRETALGIV